MLCKRQSFQTLAAVAKTYVILLKIREINMLGPLITVKIIYIHLKHTRYGHVWETKWNKHVLVEMNCSHLRHWLFLLGCIEYCKRSHKRRERKKKFPGVEINYSWPTNKKSITKDTILFYKDIHKNSNNFHVSHPYAHIVVMEYHGMFLTGVYGG